MPPSPGSASARSWNDCRRVWPPSSGTGGPVCRPVSANGWPWPAPGLRNAPVLLLDEPTANLDGQTEEAVLTAVRTLMVGRTVVIAAHRPLLAEPGRPGHLAGSQWGRSNRDRSGDDEPGRAGADRAHTGHRPTQRTAGLLWPALLGAGAIAADIGLMGCAAWLISRAAQHPNESVLALAIVGVQFFGLTRGFLRYEERLVGHDAAFRVLAAWRVVVYRRLERIAPGGLPAFRRGDLLARIVRDVDSLQDVILRVIPPFAIALVVGVAHRRPVMWWMLPAAAPRPGRLALIAGRHPGALAHRSAGAAPGSDGTPTVRGDLGASVVDLTQGAPELVAFGAAEAHSRKPCRGQDARPGRHRHRPRPGHGRHRAGPHHPVVRAGLLGLPHGAAFPPVLLGPPRVSVRVGRHRRSSPWRPSSWSWACRRPRRPWPEFARRRPGSSP